MDCPFHNILESLRFAIRETIDIHYQLGFFEHWLGDRSYLEDIYRRTIEEILGEPLEEEDIITIEKKGKHLERSIAKWYDKWKNNHPELRNQQMPKECLFLKIDEYISYQLHKADIITIIGRPC